MKIQTTTNSFLALGAGVALSALAATPAAAAVVGQLGILNTSGNNPATGQPWAAGDKYHLLFVTTTSTPATSTDIAFYNAFVQTDANSQTGTYANMKTVSWFALGSTITTNAVNNAIITGSVMNAFNSTAVASNAATLWDFLQNPNNMSDLTGTDRNVWTGSAPGGVGDANDQLGAVSGTTRRHWTGWTDWGGANANQNNVDSLPMVAISEELTVIPEPSTMVLALLGGLALLRRRR